MKMIFFSSDRVEVETLSKELAEAGIACEIRGGLEPQDAPVCLADLELWIKHDQDCHGAFMFCVEREAGFAKRAAPALTIEDLWAEEPAEEPAEEIAA